MTMATDDKKNLKEKVLEAIQSGRVSMRPKWHFFFRAALLLIGVVLLSLLLLYFASFTVFSLRQSGAWFAPNFGPQGWSVFFHALPWLLILFSLLFILLLEVLVRRYSFVHRKPLLYSAIAIVLIAVIGGHFAAPLHRRPFFEARRISPGEHPPAGRAGMPFMGEFYRRFGPPLRFADMHRGTVITLTPAGFILEETDGVTSTVLLSRHTRIHSRIPFESGDMVAVFGDEQGTEIRAFGIQKIEE